MDPHLWWRWRQQHKNNLRKHYVRYNILSNGNGIMSVLQIGYTRLCFSILFSFLGKHSSIATTGSSWRKCEQMWANSRRFLYMCTTVFFQAMRELKEVNLGMGERIYWSTHKNSMRTKKNNAVWEVRKSACVWIRKQFVCGNNRQHAYTHTWASIQVSR